MPRPSGLPKPITHIKHDAPLVLFVPESDLDALRRFHFIVKRTFKWAPGQLAVPTSWQRAFAMADVGGVMGATMPKIVGVTTGTGNA